ncbi:hypothetical protein PYW07_015854 [Mythimna separata]|uniref:Ig-like domain-containing protein n=1 Tax=Mythimna separata TaxID=271217 RepID=A0AAD7YS13_MYTSE|nr:hypothetical protein PYW07_015854 [Mythimna separata]
MFNYNQFIAVLVLITANLDFQTYAFRVFYMNGVETILALENETINIECKTDSPMTYCGFLHPSGKRYSFSGTTLNAGHCAITIEANKNDTGEWKCHVGMQIPGVENMQTIQVRVVTELAAVKQNITGTHGRFSTLACATTKGMVPLSYCRFEPPNGQPFAINTEVTRKNPILGRYYFPDNRSLDRGDCAVTIQHVGDEDVGTWTCGAGFDDGEEHIDFIQFEVAGLHAMSTAQAPGLIFGVFAIIGLLAALAVVVWKKRRFLGVGRPPGAVDTVEAEAHELEPLPLSPSPQRSPQPSARVPIVVIQSPSPSERSSSPAAL